MKNLIFVPCVLYFGNVFKIERRLSAIFGSYFQFCTYLSNNIHVDILLEIKSSNFSLPHWQDGVVVAGRIYSKLYLDISLRTDNNFIRTEKVLKSFTSNFNWQFKWPPNDRFLFDNFLPILVDGFFVFII